MRDITDLVDRGVLRITDAGGRSFSYELNEFACRASIGKSLGSCSSSEGYAASVIRARISTDQGYCPIPLRMCAGAVQCTGLADDQAENYSIWPLSFILFGWFMLCKIPSLPVCF